MPLTPEELAKMVVDYREECDAGHQRLRTDFREFHDHAEMAFANARSRTDLLEGRVGALEKGPDVRDVKFPTTVMVAIVLATISVVSTGVTVGFKVTNRIDALGTEMSRQADDDKKDRARLAQTNDERNARYEKSLDALARQVELLKYEQQRLREDVTKVKGSTR